MLGIHYWKLILQNIITNKERKIYTPQISSHIQETQSTV